MLLMLLRRCKSTYFQISWLFKSILELLAMTSKSVHSGTEIIQVDMTCISCSYILHTLVHWQSFESLMPHSSMQTMCSDRGFLHSYAIYLLYSYRLKRMTIPNSGSWTRWHLCLARCLWSVLLDMDKENYKSYVHFLETTRQKRAHLTEGTSTGIDCRTNWKNDSVLQDKHGVLINATALHMP